MTLPSLSARVSVNVPVALKLGIRVPIPPAPLAGWPLVQEGTQGENHRDDGSRCQGCSGDANSSVGMVGNRAVRDRRQSSSPNDASVEQREGSAELAFPRQFRNGPVEDRRRAVENDSQKWKEDECWFERQHQRRHHEEGCRRLRGDHAANHAEVLAEPTAACLAQGASCKNQGEADTEGGFIAALGVKKKRQKQKVAHARRGIARADGE